MAPADRFSRRGGWPSRGDFGSFGGAPVGGQRRRWSYHCSQCVDGAGFRSTDRCGNNPIANPGLWGLSFGNGGNGGDPNLLYFNAGIQNEQQGLFGSISPVPEPSSGVLLSLAGLSVFGGATSGGA